jgi:hypothetical protein
MTESCVLGLTPTDTGAVKLKSIEIAPNLDPQFP